MISRRWKASAAAAPALGVSLLPKVICPMCAPVLAAVVSALGLGFLMSTRYLLPLSIVLLAVAVGALAFGASSRRGRAPFWTGLAAAACLLIGKFWFDSTTATYTGVGLLVLASVWNAIPTRTTTSVCPQCLPTDAGSTN